MVNSQALIGLKILRCKVAKFPSNDKVSHSLIVSSYVHMREHGMFSLRMYVEHTFPGVGSANIQAVWGAQVSAVGAHSGCTRLSGKT